MQQIISIRSIMLLALFQRYKGITLLAVVNRGDGTRDLAFLLVHELLSLFSDELQVMRDEAVACDRSIIGGSSEGADDTVVFRLMSIALQDTLAENLPGTNKQGEIESILRVPFRSYELKYVAFESAHQRLVKPTHWVRRAVIGCKASVGQAKRTGAAPSARRR
ncbi:putative mnn4-regulates the mannosylphosphorylation [Moniliophthora roreri]|nr:putative mnn4-regulates the mannosylphosphorylation [Moniliophthora roreri]